MANGGVYPMDQMQHLPAFLMVMVWSGLVWSGGVRLGIKLLLLLLLSTAYSLLDNLRFTTDY
ncbi:hypothetical protein N7509_004236 [Penicillium cosmopolitanum]|uniref:Uncharacterized protein n=1 Tax=Penicillium cosmopolitanum TaxID=1131564 RepID=A0A9X0BC46_9EURO|nr:uncharacterized protein N7509_004236 [Penicillium cosmopolitanum]KAJ5404365.1 hypothetical protein N7509_004236 [Penicillium cosmopolitanum]